MPGQLSKFLASAQANPRGAAVVVAVSSSLVAYLMWRSSKKAAAQRLEKDAVLASMLHDKKEGIVKSEKAAVNGLFIRRLIKILRILIPSVFSPEVAYMVLVAVMLVLRTYCDVWMIQNGTAVEASIISRSAEGFKQNVGQFIMAMPLISTVNNILKYGLNALELRFRTRLSVYLYGKYMNNFTFYKMSNLDNRISNADQLLTQDVEKFCSTLTDLYSNLSKPVLDICLYVYQLTSSIGPTGPASMVLYLAVSGVVLTSLRGPVGQMTVKEQHLEGELRYVNSRIITNSEEIAFYEGTKREKMTLMDTFRRLISHLQKFIKFRSSMGFLDNIVAKYLATVVGYYVVSRPFFSPNHPALLGATHHDLVMHYYKSGRMLVRMAEAIGRLVLAGRELTRLAGFTARVDELLRVLKDLQVGRYQRTMVSSKPVEEQDNDLVPAVPLVPGAGEVVEADRLIRFEHVPLVTPNGDVLVKELNFEVKSGMNVLVCGPNGCGKSSLFRILGELWPLFGGRMVKPRKSKLFYIPQRPYMAIGTLRDQVIYPDSVDDMAQKGLSDDMLQRIMNKVQLSYLLEREGSWDAVQDWMDVLSGGEKQRIAMARLFYHEPQFAILDECTSAVSVDVESIIYSHCKERGITLFTVSHRKSLWVHHEFVLQFDGRGGYEYRKIEEGVEEFGS